MKRFANALVVTVGRLLVALGSVALGSFASGADASRVDWLLNPAPFVSEVRFDESARELTLTNGLVERRIALEPNAATVSLRNLTSGEEFVRAIAPEGRIVLDGESFPIGGFAGAPVANYWREEWRDSAKPLDGAYRFDRWEVGEIEERFPYKKRSEWLSRDVEWPPKGKRLSLFFLPPIEIPAVTQGEKLFEEPFLEELDQSWTEKLSALSPRTSVKNEGKPGEIYAPIETCAYLEREWTPGAARSTSGTTSEPILGGRGWRWFSRTSSSRSSRVRFRGNTSFASTGARSSSARSNGKRTRLSRCAWKARR